MMYNTSRIPQVVAENLDPAQRKIFDRIAAPRHGLVSGPYPAWVRFPELCTNIYDMLELLCKEDFLDKRTREVVTLALGRLFNCQHLWSSHRAKALASGIPEQVVEAINNREPIPFDENRDRLVFEMTTVLGKGELVPQALYDEVVTEYGEDGIIKIATYVGHYMMVGAVMNTVDVRVQLEENTLRLD